MTEMSEQSQTIDRCFAIRRVLAHGGMSDLFEAEHSLTGRRVVVKVLPREKRSHVEMRERLLREARLLELARGEGVVQVLTAGECTTFGPYIVMELLVGRPLDGLLLARGALKPEDALRVFIPLAETMARMHEFNIVHRDIKPANIFVAQTDDRSRTTIKLLDFGVSTLTGTKSTPDKLTFVGELLGTVEYMAPEQVTAQHHQIDARSDIFSFGASLFEALTGILPLGNDPLARYRAVQYGVIAQTLEQLLPGTDHNLSALVAQMLSFEREARPQSMRAVAELLRTGAGPGPVGEQVPARAPQARPLSRPEGTNAPLSPIVAPRGAEQRRAPRAPYLTPVRMATAAATEDCRSEDISEGGMFLHSKSAPHPGEIVTLKFALPVSGAITQQRAIVRWHRTQNGRVAIGLEWLEPPQALTSEVAEYLRYMKHPSVNGTGR